MSEIRHYICCLLSASLEKARPRARDVMDIAALSVRPEGQFLDVLMRVETSFPLLFFLLYLIDRHVIPGT